jgi:hypothetical protein
VTFESHIIGVSGAVIRESLLATVESVEETGLERRADESESLVLGVDVDELLGNRAEERESDRSIVDESTRLARRRELATKDEVVVVVEVIVGKGLLQREFRNVESSFDNTFALRVEKDARVGPLAQNESQSTQKDGLTGTCLASDDRKAAVERDVGSGNERIVLDM